MKKKTKEKVPWKRLAPKKARHTKLTNAQKQKAKASAKKAGRPYPNLIDNMKVAKRRSRIFNNLKELRSPPSTGS
jgi:hypothetical protein